MTRHSHTGATQSRFVTVTAGAVILLSLTSILSNFFYSGGAEELIPRQRIYAYIYSAVAVCAGLGLLDRREWGRKLMLGLLASLVPATIYQTYVFARHYPAVTQTVRWLMAYMVLMCCLCAWLIYRLCSQKIRDEFAQRP